MGEWYTISPACVAYGNEDEIVILRDCVRAMQIWIRLVAYNHITNFLSLTYMDWIFDNMTRSHNREWHTTFMVLALVDVEK
jgi:hypothetical protein